MLYHDIIYVSFNRPSSVEFYDGNSHLPIFGRPNKGYNCEQIVHILLDPLISEELISSTSPVYVHHNVSFIVDLSKLKNPNDVRADDLGSWKCTGSRISTFHVDIRDGTCCIVSNESASLTARVVHIQRQYHVHGTDPDLHRLIAFVERKYLCVCMCMSVCFAYGNTCYLYCIGMCM